MRYFYVSSKGRVEMKYWSDSHADNRRLFMKNCFETKEQAEDAKLIIRDALMRFFLRGNL